MPPAAQPPKRSAGACQHCRARKTKCSGTQPCTKCQKSRKQCVFEEDRRVSVSQREFAALKRKLELLESSNTPSQRISPTEPPLDETRTPQTLENPSVYHPDSGLEDEDWNDNGKEAQGEDAFLDHNPLVSPSSFVHCAHRRRRTWYFQGPTSSLAFTQRVIHQLTSHLDTEARSDIPLISDGDTYRISWEQARSDELPDISDLPSHDHAVYLFSTVKFHMADLFQLYDESEFLSHLDELYDNVKLTVQTSRLWYIQFLVMLAFAEAFLCPSPKMASTPAGSRYFTRAMSLLPAATQMWEDPLLAVEVLAAIALYLYSVDMRDSSSCYIGQALRMATIEGLHRKLPPEMNAKIADRCTRIWWTIYILESKISSSEGVPSAIRDEDITATLWDPLQCTRSAAGLSLHVKVTQAMSQGLRAVYGPGDTTLYLHKLQSSLRRMTSLYREWEQVSQRRFNDSVNAVSGLSTRLDLSYHLCVITIIRPLVFSLLVERLDNITTRKGPRTVSPTVRTLLRACANSAAKSVKLLGTLRDHNVLEHFLPFDLEYTSSAVFVLRLVSVLLPSELVLTPYTQMAREILNSLISNGNRLAISRLTEWDQLEQLIASLPQPVSFPDIPPAQKMPSLERPSRSRLVEEAEVMRASGSPIEEVWDSHGEGVGLLSDQLLSVVNQLAGEGLFMESNIGSLGEDRWLWNGRQ